jgi:hypothetical protein
MIRKLSFGVDYKNAMHYTSGQPFGRSTIDVIRKVNPNHFEIYVKDREGVVFLWKEVIDMPCVVEYDIEAFN